MTEEEFVTLLDEHYFVHDDFYGSGCTGDHRGHLGCEKVSSFTEWSRHIWQEMQSAKPPFPEENEGEAEDTSSPSFL